ncbi:piggyBac transposable element-derived protein 3-like [Hydra vulgaris]|uniref:PiggyBac transposable element-derived protein 3-like n=1 Tax=Hydra vulgaris TaxID=6087 RepID=A0ABM4BNX8_HYDVU
MNCVYAQYKRHVGLTLNEIAALLENQDANNVIEIIMILSVDKTLTDKDNDEEEDGEHGKDIIHLGAGILNQQAEIINTDGDVINSVDSDTGNTNNKSDIFKYEVIEAVGTLLRKKNKDRTWRNTCGPCFGAKVPEFQEITMKSLVDDDCILPYNFLRLFLDDKFIQNVSNMSSKYGCRKGYPEEAFLMKKDNLLTSIAVMYVTGYITPANRRLYWEEKEDAQNMFIKRAISRDIFKDVLQFTYFVDEHDVDLTDAFWKVRPIFDQINSSAKRYGWKVWCLATAEGKLLACQPYAGLKTKNKNNGLGQGPDVVLSLSEQYGLKKGIKVACDNLFTYFDLPDHMGKHGWGVVG